MKKNKWVDIWFPDVIHSTLPPYDLDAIFPPSDLMDDMLHIQKAVRDAI